MTAEVKFVEFLPAARRVENPDRMDLGTLVAALEARPGQWAEVERLDSRSKLSARANYITRRSAYRDRVECAVRKIAEDEFALFARAVSA